MARISVGKAADLKPGAMKKVEVPGMDDIVVANVEGKFYAMRGICNHQGGPLSEGELDSNIITCPWHGAQWDVTTGKLSEFPLELEDEPVYKVVVEGDDVFIDV